MPDNELIEKLNANRTMIANILGLPEDWVGPAFGDATSGAIHIRVTPKSPAGPTPPHVYLFTIPPRIGDVGLPHDERLPQGAGREAARLRGELAHDGYLWLLQCADQLERNLLAEAQHHLGAEPDLRGAGATTAGLLGLIELLGKAVEAQRGGNLEQLHHDLMRLAGGALAVARSTRG